MTIQMASFPLPLQLRNSNARQVMAIGETETPEFASPFSQVCATLLGFLTRSVNFKVAILQCSITRNVRKGLRFGCPAACPFIPC